MKPVKWDSVKNLDCIYKPSRTLKDEVLIAWADRLRGLMLSGPAGCSGEASRRIYYIETVLIGRNA